jgi:dipeptidyl aminopeptidase/acylaminoacyl peptidase
VRWFRLFLPLAVLLLPILMSMVARGAARAQIAPAVGRLVIQTESGGAFYTINPDGTDPVLIYQGGMDPAWSPDSTKIAFARLDDPVGIFVMNPDGSGVTRVADVDGARAPTWSPDGSKLVYFRQTKGYRLVRVLQLFPGGVVRPGFSVDESPNWRLFGVELANGNIFEVLSSPHSFDPSYSPGGTQIVYACNDGLCITDDQHHEPQLIPGTDAQFSSPAWSPDGQWIAFQFHKSDHTDLGLIRPDGSDMHLITEEPLFSENPPSNVSPAWSPDSQQIAFLSDREGPWKHYLMNSDGSGQRKLTDLPAYYQYSAERMSSWGIQPPTRPQPPPPARFPTPTPTPVIAVAPPTSNGPVEVVEVFPDPVVNFQLTRITARAPEGAILRVKVVYCGNTPAFNGTLLRDIKIDATGLGTWDWTPVTGGCHTTGRVTVTADYNGQQYTATRDFRIQ